MIMKPISEKSELRKRLRHQRNALGHAYQARAAAGLIVQLKTMPVFQHSTYIALYLANDGEIDPAAVLQWCLACGKRCYAPVIIGNEKLLRFAEITAHTDFNNNRFGIAEPAVAEAQLIDAPELDLVLLPLVGFDSHGNRIGMGGGFYDTTFAFQKTNPRSTPQLIGLAHEIQRVENITADNWDIPISAVITDQRIYRCDGCWTDSDDNHAKHNVRNEG